MLGGWRGPRGAEPAQADACRCVLRLTAKSTPGVAAPPSGGDGPKSSGV